MRQANSAALTAAPQPVRWQSLVLVVAGFAVGMLAHQMARPGLALTATCVSIGALVAVTALSIIARTRQESRQRLTLERKLFRLHYRLERHCLNVPRPHLAHKSKTPRSDRQYLTVVGRPVAYRH